MDRIEDTTIAMIVRRFEEATIARDEWKHAEHMIVGLHYLENNSFEAAAGKIRHGIINLLSAGFKVDLSKEMPYHETLTLFWMKTLQRLSESMAGKSLKDKAAEAVRQFDKEYPMRFYSRALLFSEAARTEYVLPDLVPEDKVTLRG